jgi:hypothetical protein
MSRIDVPSRPSPTYEGPSLPAAAPEWPRIEEHTNETNLIPEAARGCEMSGAIAEVLNDIYAAPLPWRVTVTSTLLALAILAATR